MNVVYDFPISTKSSWLLNEVFVTFLDGEKKKCCFNSMLCLMSLMCCSINPFIGDFTSSCLFN
jgi:hypothetical protein